LIDGPSSSNEQLSVCSPQTVGFAAGRWLVFGSGAQSPGDQRSEAGGSLVFDSEVLDESLSLLGATFVHLRVASDKPCANIAATLSEILPDSSVTRLTYGLLKLAHRDSDIDLKALQPHRFYDIKVVMSECGQSVSSGSRLRLAISTSYFPIIWPQPEAATLTFDLGHCKLDRSIRSPSSLDRTLTPFQPAANGPPLKTKPLRAGSTQDTITEDLSTGETTAVFGTDSGLLEIEDDGWRFGNVETAICTIHPSDPQSARVEQRFRKEFGRERLTLLAEGWLKMTVTSTDFCVTGKVVAKENERSLFERDYAYTIPRHDS